MANNAKLMTAAIRHIPGVWAWNSLLKNLKVGDILKCQDYDYKYIGHISEFGVKVDEVVHEDKDVEFSGNFHHATEETKDIGFMGAGIAGEFAGEAAVSLVWSFSKSQSSSVMCIAKKHTYLQHPETFALATGAQIKNQIEGNKAPFPWSMYWGVVSDVWQASSMVAVVAREANETFAIGASAKGELADVATGSADARFSTATKGNASYSAIFPPPGTRPKGEMVTIAFKIFVFPGRDYAKPQLEHHHPIGGAG